MTPLDSPSLYPVPPRRDIPTPAEVQARTGLRRRYVPPILGPDRHPGALYWLDTCVALAFAHASQLGLLAAHYGDSLVVVEDVHREADSIAHRPIPPLPRDATALERADRQRRVAVKDAARALCAGSGLRTLGPAISIPLTTANRVLELRYELAGLPQAEPPPDLGDLWRHRGEAAIVCAYELRRDDSGGSLPSAMLSNDGKARLLAKVYGMAGRTAADVLREMVRAGTGNLVANDAWALYCEMRQVSELPDGDGPNGPGDLN